MESSSSTARSIPVILKTSTPYPIPAEKYMIPVTWRRFHLSQLINKVLSLPNPIPFDFVVGGEMISGSLGEWCAEKEVDEEETLVIEYIESVMPPQVVSSIPHPDWVSSVSCQTKGFFLTASYDSHVRLFNDRQESVYTVEGHTAPVSSVCYASSPASEDEDSQFLIASASYDTTARLTLLSNPQDLLSAEASKTPRTVASLHLHTAPLSSIASNSSGSHLITTGWDGLVGLWTTAIPQSDEVPLDVSNPAPKKRRKTQQIDVSVKRKGPENVLKSHTSKVSDAKFSPVASERNRVYSCGWDHTLRSWDIEFGLCTSTTTAAEKVMLGLAITPDGSSVITACADRTVLVYSSTSLSSYPHPHMLPHPSLASCVSAHPTSSNHIITGAHDGVVRIWDLRSVKSPVSSIVVGDEKNKGKLLSVDWGEGGVVGVAGEKGLNVLKADVGY